MPSYRDLEKQLWGRASVAGETSDLPESGPSPFRQPMSWLKQALGLQSGSPPQVLDTNRIISAMDVTQGGWPFAKFEGFGASVTGPVVGAFFINMVPVDATSQYIIQGIHIGNGAAVPLTGYIWIGSVQGTAGGAGWPPVGRPIQATTAPVFTNLGTVINMVAQWTIAPGAQGATIDLIGARVIIVPPGFTLTIGVNVGLAGAGDVVQLDVTWARIPAGFKSA